MKPSTREGLRQHRQGGIQCVRATVRRGVGGTEASGGEGKALHSLFFFVFFLAHMHRGRACLFDVGQR